MSDPRPTSRSLTALDGAIALVSILLVVQMWLLTATLEAFLGGHYGVVGPGALISGALFTANVALYRFIEGIDRVASRGGPKT